MQRRSGWVKWVLEPSLVRRASWLTVRTLATWGLLRKSLSPFVNPLVPPKSIGRPKTTTTFTSNPSEMRNTEHIEAQLSVLGGHPVIVVEPHHGTISFSYSGTLSVTVGDSGHGVGFHLFQPMGALAIIFFAEDVVSLEDPKGMPVKKIIRLKGPSSCHKV